MTTDEFEHRKKAIADLHAYLDEQFRIAQSDISMQYEKINQYRNAALAEIESARLALFADRDRAIADVERYVLEHFGVVIDHRIEPRPVLN